MKKNSLLKYCICGARPTKPFKVGRDTVFLCKAHFEAAEKEGFSKLKKNFKNRVAWGGEVTGKTLKGWYKSDIYG